MGLELFRSPERLLLKQWPGFLAARAHWPRGGRGGDPPPPACPGL